MNDGLPLDGVEQRCNADRQICEHEQGKSECVQYLFRRAAIDVFPLAYRGYRSDNKHHKTGVEYKLLKRLKQPQFKANCGVNYILLNDALCAGVVICIIA